MSAPSYTTPTYQTFSAAATHDVTLPAGLDETKWVVLFIGVRASAGGHSAVGMDTDGWTYINGSGHSHGSSTGTQTGIYARRCTADESSTTVTIRTDGGTGTNPAIVAVTVVSDCEEIIGLAAGGSLSTYTDTLSISGSGSVIDSVILGFHTWRWFSAASPRNVDTWDTDYPDIRVETQHPTEYLSIALQAQDLTGSYSGVEVILDGSINWGMNHLVHFVPCATTAPCDPLITGVTKGQSSSASTSHSITVPANTAGQKIILAYATDQEVLATLAAGWTNEHGAAMSDGNGGWFALDCRDADGTTSYNISTDVSTNLAYIALVGDNIDIVSAATQIDYGENDAPSPGLPTPAQSGAGPYYQLAFLAVFGSVTIDDYPDDHNIREEQSGNSSIRLGLAMDLACSTHEPNDWDLSGTEEWASGVFIFEPDCPTAVEFTIGSTCGGVSSDVDIIPVKCVEIDSTIGGVSSDIDATCNPCLDITSTIAGITNVDIDIETAPKAGINSTIGGADSDIDAKVVKLVDIDQTVGGMSTSGVATVNNPVTIGSTVGGATTAVDIGNPRSVTIASTIGGISSSITPKVVKPATIASTIGGATSDISAAPGAVDVTIAGAVAGMTSSMGATRVAPVTIGSTIGEVSTTVDGGVSGVSRPRTGAGKECADCCRDCVSEPKLTCFLDDGDFSYTVRGADSAQIEVYDAADDPGVDDPIDTYSITLTNGDADGTFVDPRTSDPDYTICVYAINACGEARCCRTCCAISCIAGTNVTFFDIPQLYSNPGIVTVPAGKYAIVVRVNLDALNRPNGTHCDIESVTLDGIDMATDPDAVLYINNLNVQGSSAVGYKFFDIYDSSNPAAHVAYAVNSCNNGTTCTAEVPCCYRTEQAAVEIADLDYEYEHNLLLIPEAPVWQQQYGYTQETRRQLITGLDAVNGTYLQTHHGGNIPNGSCEWGGIDTGVDITYYTEVITNRLNGDVWHSWVRWTMRIWLINLWPPSDFYGYTIVGVPSLEESDSPFFGPQSTIYPPTTTVRWTLGTFPTTQFRCQETPCCPDCKTPGDFCDIRLVLGLGDNLNNAQQECMCWIWCRNSQQRGLIITGDCVDCDNPGLYPCEFGTAQGRVYRV